MNGVASKKMLIKHNLKLSYCLFLYSKLDIKKTYVYLYY